METYVKKFIKEFNENIERTGKLPMFEIGDQIYKIKATQKGLETMYGPSVKWDPYLDLDEHLQALYDLCLQDAQEDK